MTPVLTQHSKHNRKPGRHDDVAVAERRPATMQDIARRVGVSKMAVSAVLSGTSTRVSVSDETRERILAVARQLEYRPNALARSFRTRRTNIIGFYSGYRYLDPRNTFFAEVVGGLQEGCAAHRKDLLLHSVFREDSTDDIYSELVDGRIDGLVLTAPTEDPLVERLAASHLPVIVVSDAVPQLPSVLVDDAQAARLTFDYLRERGHRSIVYCSEKRHLISAERRRDAYLTEAASRGLRLTEWRAPARADENDRFLAAWQREPSEQRPTAAICWNDIAAYQLLAACHDLRIRVPEDLAVVGFDGDPNPLSYRWRLTTVRAPWAAAAQTAVGLLVSQLDGSPPPHQTILPVTFLPGDSA
jgi:DNA-binding LacI/PurR family transcriptional regulator